MSADRSANAAGERFVASALAAAIAEVLTLPIDITKVRLQTQVKGPDGKLPHAGQMAIGRQLIATEGVGALWKGIVPALVRQCSYTGLSLVLYEPLRNAIGGDTPTAELPFYKRVLAGGCAGGISIFVMNPTDVLKARMQNSTTTLQLGPTFKEIWAKSGVRGLWAGTTPNVARCFVGNACELGCYDQFKTTLIESKNPLFGKDSTLTHIGASTGAGFVSSICSNPVDVLKTRLQASAGLSNESLIGLATRIPREEGFSAFYKGFWPLFQRKVVWTVFFFVSYEKIKAGIHEATS